MTPAWLLENVVPHLNAFYGGRTDIDNPALVLAYPLLWAAMSPEMEGRMDDEQRQRIQEAYYKIETLPTGVNPVVRTHLYVRRVKDTVVIDETHAETVTTTTNNPTSPVAAAAATAAAVTPNTAIPNTAPMASAPGLDQEFKNMLFSQHQQVVSMLTNYDRALQTMFTNFRRDVFNELSTINQHVCR